MSLVKRWVERCKILCTVDRNLCVDKRGVDQCVGSFVSFLIDLIDFICTDLLKLWRINEISI